MSTLHLANNARIADTLEQVADLYDAQNGDAFRVRAYRSAAATLRGLDTDVAELWSREGPRGLQQLPHVGPNIARAIAQWLQSGRLALLERLQGELGPEHAFTSIPGIGKELAHRVHEHLHVTTLEQLEAAAHDGRLDSVPGFGPRRTRAVREVLGSVLRGRRLGRPRSEPVPARPHPSVEQLLDIDSRYRDGAQRDALPKIAPRRFNPNRTAWLPILHFDHDGVHYTALFSNTALAHKLGTTHDWVVIFYEGAHGDGQCTVVTERRGALTGKRVVRGREAECERLYGREPHHGPEPLDAGHHATADATGRPTPRRPSGTAHVDRVIAGTKPASSALRNPSTGRENHEQALDRHWSSRRSADSASHASGISSRVGDQP